MSNINVKFELRKKGLGGQVCEHICYLQNFLELHHFFYYAFGFKEISLKYPEPQYHNSTNRNYSSIWRGKKETDFFVLLIEEV